MIVTKKSADRHEKVRKTADTNMTKIECKTQQFPENRMNTKQTFF